MLIKPFGPEIYHSKLSIEDNDILYDICMKNKEVEDKKRNKTLVGLIDQEFDILFDIKDRILPILTDMVLDYLNTTTTISKSLLPIRKREIHCRASWCNIQVANEFNPIHNHIMDDIVCVCFPKVDIQTKQKYVTNDYVHPGTLAFHYGENLKPFGNTAHFVKPETGDVYIFPAGLKHYTFPVYGENDVRISTSSNFAFSDYFNMRLYR